MSGPAFLLLYKGDSSPYILTLIHRVLGIIYGLLWTLKSVGDFRIIITV